MKKLLKVFTKLREKAFPLPQLLQNFTITECIYKFVNGKINLQEKSWGWKLTDSGYSPVLTDLPPAPAELLKVIRCNCTTDCTSARCTCRKNGLKCTLACGHCQGTSCTNGSTVDMAEEDSDEADDQD